MSPKSAEEAKRKFEDELEVTPSKRTRSSGTASFFVPLEGAPGAKPTFVPALTPRRRSQPSSTARSSVKSSRSSQKARHSDTGEDVSPPASRSTKPSRSSRNARPSETDQDISSPPPKMPPRKSSPTDTDRGPMPRIADKSEMQAPATPNAKRHKDIADSSSISSGRPRYFMEAVEIRTPRSLTKAGPSRSLEKVPSSDRISPSQSSSRPLASRKPPRNRVLSEDDDHGVDELSLVPQSSRPVARLSIALEAVQMHSPSAKSTATTSLPSRESDGGVPQRRGMASTVSNSSPIKSSPLKRARIASPEVKDSDAPPAQERHSGRRGTSLGTLGVSHNRTSVPAPSFYTDDSSDDSMVITPSRPSRVRSPATQTSSPQTRVSPTCLSHKSPSRSPTKISTNLPSNFEPFLEAQKRTCLAALVKPPLLSSFPHQSDTAGTDAVATASIVNLLRGTIDRGEGNSCLVLGPRGSGKTRIVREAISQLAPPSTLGRNGLSLSAQSSASPIVIWLSGHAQTNDKLAMKEIGRQLVLQTGSKDLAMLDDDESDDEDESENEKGPRGVTHLSSILPPASHLPSLITTLSSLPRPTIIILDAFDLFMGHARQALLYCLLDTVQSCRAGEGKKGVAVVGITSRVDSLNLLEKRVKSRFSHRIIRCSPPSNVLAYVALARTMLKTPLDPGKADSDDEDAATETSLQLWRAAWDQSVNAVLDTREAQHVFKETFELVRDIGLLCRILTPVLLDRNPTSPWITTGSLVAAARQQRAPDRFPFLSELSYPCLSLMVAANHVHTAGHEAFTFEHLFDTFSRAAKQSSNVNVSLDGVGIGLQKLPREILFAAFENLVSIRIFQHSGTSSSSTARQFVKFRCEADKKDIKSAVDKKNHTQLKRWFSRPT